MVPTGYRNRFIIHIYRLTRWIVKYIIPTIIVRCFLFRLGGVFILRKSSIFLSL
eukprot:UN26660